MFFFKKKEMKEAEFAGKKLKVAILGYGGRGKMYAGVAKWLSGYEVVAVIENNSKKREVAKSDHHLADNQLFNSLDDFLATPKIADWLFICTQDKDHHEHSIKSLNKGYDLILEKPIATTVEDCIDIERVAKELGKKVAVCHVLRYSTYYERILDVMRSGQLGKIIAIDQIENVAYWHQAHSFVRGDWRITEESNPMIMAKCCHDLDIAVYLADSACEQVVSTGRLNFFKKEFAPEGATEYCMGGCKAKTKCPYDAEKIYIERAKKLPKIALKGAWPQSRLMDDGEVTIPKLYEAIKKTRYGKCVFLSDNDVVDYQVTTMQFKNGITSTLTMTAFSDECYRETRIRGTLGELICNMETNELTLCIFGKKRKKLKGSNIGGSHGGGDLRLMKSLRDGTFKTDISKSIESHLIGFAAEESRLNGSAPVKIDDYRNKAKK